MESFQPRALGLERREREANSAKATAQYSSFLASFLVLGLAAMVWLCENGCASLTQRILVSRDKRRSVERSVGEGDAVCV
jgi:hypothetical protein